MPGTRKAGTLRVVLGDQCSRELSSLRDLDPTTDMVLMAEVMGECTYVKHHPKKIVMVLSAMRHFAQAVRARGVRVDYVALDDPANTHTLAGEVARAAVRLGAERIVVTQPGEWRVAEDIAGWQQATGIETVVRDDDRFICSTARFRAWARGKRSLRMEFFYREMRRETGLLMDADSAPEGGQWNFDAENRKPLPRDARVPIVPAFPPDAITQQVMALVAARFPDHFGSVEGFGFPVTARDAEAALDAFIAQRLERFGDYQDAMATDQPTLFHSLISPAMNAGLLLPLDVCRRVEQAYREGRAGLNAVEGFIRQILGWREYVRGIYWHFMPDYAQRNELGADRPLPWLYWSGETRMRCLAQAIGQTRDLAYAHHIQRLMITGNFALLGGFRPDQVNEWYLVVYADAYEWVELPNTHGMAIHADGGIMASKPYAASGAYINRMSDYCRDCHYDVKQAVGDRACPFNHLYWDFIARHADRFESNPRMSMPIRGLRRMAPEKVAAMRAQSAAFLSALERGERL